MKPELLHVLQHALGLDQYGQVMSASGDRPVHRYAGEKTYRNHYVTGDDDAQCGAEWRFAGTRGPRRVPPSSRP